MIRRRPLAVVAVGGHALVRSDGDADLPLHVHETTIATTARSLGEMARRHRLVVVHGNGPAEGPLGYDLDRHLASVVRASRVVTLLNQVVVDPDDPAFTDHGPGVVPAPSPAPQEIVDMETIRLLVEAGLLVVCSGGGGVPVVRSGAGLTSVEAVVDRDATAALLATGLGADLLVLLTDVAGVYHDWETDHARLLTRTTPSDLADRQFPAASMAPKVAAACVFVSGTGRGAVIASLDQAADAAAGYAGTWVLPDEPLGHRAA
jgi:carbamate kinase